MMKTRYAVLCLLIVAAAFAGPPAEQPIAGMQERLASPDYEVRKAAVTECFRSGEKRPLSKSEIALLLPSFKSDPDWRIKVRIALVLPHATDKSQVMPPLMAALQERDDDASGGGNLQIYSCKALAKIGDPTALPAMREWLSYLKSNPKEFKSRMDDLIKMTGQSIRELEEKTKDQGSKKAPEAIGAKAAPQTER